MSRLSKIFLVIAICGIGFLFLLLVGVNLYLQSEVVQERIRQATTASLGIPVQIQRATFTPWGGLTISGITAEVPEQMDRPEFSFFEAKVLHVRFAWMPLLSRKVVITSISLRDPVMVIPENQPVILLPPAERVEVTLPESPQERVETTVTSEQARSSAPEEKPSAREEQPPETRPSFVIEVHNFQIHNGKITVLSAEGQSRLVLSGVTIQTKIRSDFSMKGKLRIQEAILGGRLFLRQVDAPFRREQGKVQVQNLKASLAGGRLRGDIRVEEASGDFHADLGLQEVLLPEMLLEAGIPHARTSGKLEARIELRGGKSPEDLLGKGEVRLREATIEPVDFIKQVGQILRIKELQLLDLEEAFAIFGIEGEVLTVEHLHLQTESVMIQGEGTVGLRDGRLDLGSRILVDQSIQRNLGGLGGRFLEEAQVEGYRQLPFRVFGTTSRPQTDLLDRVGAGSIGREVGRFLQNFFSAPASKQGE